MTTATKTHSDQHAKLLSEAQAFATQLGDDAPAEDVDKLNSMLDAAQAARERAEAMRRVATEAEKSETLQAITEKLARDNVPDRPQQQMAAIAARSERNGTTATDVVDIAPAHAIRQAMDRRGLDEASAQDYLQEQMALTTGTDSTGGVFVPTVTASTLYDYMHRIVGLMTSGATIIMTADGAPLELPQITTHKAISTTLADLDTAENTAIAEQEDTFGKTVLNAHNYAGLYNVPNQLIADSVYDIEDAAAMNLMRHITEKMETLFTRGTGAAGIPKGIIHSPAAARTKTTAASNAVTANEVRDLLFMLDPGHIGQPQNLCYMMHPTFYSYLLGLVDSDGRPHFEMSRVLETPHRIHGIDVKYNGYMPGGVADNDIAAVCGHIGDAYVVRIVSQIQIAASTDAQFEKNQTVIRGVVRADGQVRDDKAVSFLKIKA